MALPVGRDSGNFFPGVLRERGYIEGQNIRFELRSDEGELRRLPELAAELTGAAQSRCDRDLVHADRNCSQTGDARDPNRLRALRGHDRNRVGREPCRRGGNVIGSTSLAAETDGKIVELIREIVPSAHRIAALANVPDPFSKSDRILKGEKAERPTGAGPTKYG
jgi:putative tryptophan/tyrosine transport system substrate-binding protein